MLNILLEQGLGPSLIGNAIAWGGFFYCYEQIKVGVGIARFCFGSTWITRHSTQQHWYYFCNGFLN